MVAALIAAVAITEGAMAAAAAEVRAAIEENDVGGEERGLGVD